MEFLFQKIFFALHWAGVEYSQKSTGAEPVSIGPEPQRLDIAFTTPSQKIPGCWIAIPIALSTVLKIGNLEPNQTYLAPGEYEIEIDIKCENGKGDKAKFKLMSPNVWQNLDMAPLDKLVINSPDFGAIEATGPKGITGPGTFSGPASPGETKKQDELHQEVLNERDEMKIVVAPLYANSRPESKKIFFMKGSPGYYDSGRNRDRDFFNFWREIRENQHLATKYLRIALKNYFMNKSNTVNEKPDDEYLKAENNLIENVEKRYRELSK